MKKWELNLIEGVIPLIIGILLFAIPMLLAMPQPHKTFLGIPYDISEEFIDALAQRLMLMVVGVFLIGIGLGTLLNTYTIYRLERRLASQSG